MWVLFHKSFGNFHDSNYNIFWLILVHIICTAVYNHKRSCVWQGNILHSPWDILNAITADTLMKCIFKIVSLNITVSPQIAGIKYNKPIKMTDTAEFFKSFFEIYVFPATQVCACMAPAIWRFWRGYCQWNSGRLYSWDLFVFNINFLNNKITSLIFLVWKLILIS